MTAPRLERVSKRERELLARELAEAFGVPEVRDAVTGRRFLKLAGRWTEYFDASVLDFEPDDLPRNAHPFSAGLPFAERMSRGEVRPHLEGARALSEEVPEVNVVVTEKAAILFTYGRDVLPGSVIEVAGPEIEGRLVVVVVEDRLGRHPVGVGRLRLTREGPLVENVMDRGWYLRRGG